MFKVKVSGTGIGVPQKAMTNDDLSKIVETSDEWIFERTGIRQRYISSPDGGEFPSDLGVKAAKQALDNAGLQPDDLDLILFATLTPDHHVPATATIVQTKLGITNKCAAIDINAACSGFVYGFNMATSMIQTGMFKNVLVIGAEMLSREVDWTDRTICILFGDGAGAAILSRADESEQSDVLSSVLGADGTGKEFFFKEHGGSASPITDSLVDSTDRFMKMKGKEMFRVATRTLAENAREVLRLADLSLEDVNWVVPHQANMRIIETTAKLIGMSMDRMIVNIDKYANTSAATVPIAFHEAIESGKIKRGDIVMFDAFGAGLTSGATLLRY